MVNGEYFPVYQRLVYASDALTIHDALKKYLFQANTHQYNSTTGFLLTNKAASAAYVRIEANIPISMLFCYATSLHFPVRHASYR